MNARKACQAILSGPGVAEALGGHVGGPVWTHKDGRNVATVGALRISRADTAKAYWRIVRIENEGGGERHITENYTAGELLAYLEGVRAVVTGRHK